MRTSHVTSSSLLAIATFVSSATANAGLNVEFGTLTPGTNGIQWFNQVQEQFIVPLLPTDHGQTFALWFGIGGPTTVVQVLLEYLPAHGPRAASWYILNEVASLDGLFNTGHQTAVAPGTSIQGIVQVDTSGTCSNNTLGQGCSWQSGFSINSGPWQWDVFTPQPFYTNGTSEIPAQEIFATVYPGSIEMQTLPYSCDFMPNIPWVDWAVLRIAQPVFNWNEFTYVSAGTGDIFGVSPGLTQWPATSLHCQEAWSVVGEGFALWWNANAAPGQMFEN